MSLAPKLLKQYKAELTSVLQNISNAKTLDAFLVDILTPQELEEIVTRWQLVKLLDQGVPQRTIAKKLGVSIAKITRGSRELMDTHGGFRQVLDLTAKKIKK